MTNSGLHHTTSRRKLIFIGLLFVLLVCVTCILRTSHSSAYYDNPNNYLPNGTPGNSNFYFDIWNYENICSSIPEKYFHVSWISPAGDPKRNASTVTLPRGTRYVNLQYNHFIFVCNDISDIGSYFSYAFLPAEGRPTRAALQSNVNIIGWSRVTAGPGSLSTSPEGAWAVNSKVDDGCAYGCISRYWMGDQVPFTYDAGPGGLNGSVDIQIAIDSISINNFSSGSSVCVGVGWPTSWGCPWGTDYFNMRIEIEKPPAPTVKAECPSDNNLVQLEWNFGLWGNGTGFIVDIDNDNDWNNGFYNKGVGYSTDTNAPDGFSGWAGLTGVLSMKADDTYYVRVWNGFTHTNTLQFRAPNCSKISSCTVTTTPSTPEPGQNFILKIGFKVSGGNISNDDNRMRVKIPSIDFFNREDGRRVSYTKSADTEDIYTYDSSPASYSIANTGIHEITVTISNIGGDNLECPPLTITAKPYVQFYSGDVSAGDSFKIDGGACQLFGSGGINTYNNADSPNYTGSGSQLAAFARGSINEFVSSALRTAISPRPRALSFANTAPTYGGNFGSSSQCIDDYWADNGGTPISGAVSLNGYTTNTYKSAGNLTINASTIPLGQKITIYIDGNLTIANNITYAAFNNLAQIPMLRLIVKGDVYINSAVSEISGNIIAIPKSDGTNGTIYTCTNGSTTGSSNWVAQNCGNPLTFYGAITARQLRLLRTFGTKRGSTWQPPLSSQAAERFINSPESWLVLPSSNSGVGNDKWDSITSLPPVL